MDRLDDCYCELGESPVWNPIFNCYHWVDINLQKIFTIDSNFHKIDVIHTPDKVTCVVVNQDGNLIATLSREIVKVNLKTKKITSLLSPDISSQEMFNDGKVDAKGRFWITSKDINEGEPLAKLYCLDGEKFRCKDTGFTVGNGIGWSVDNQWMYFTDSPKKIIYRYKFDLDRAGVNEREEFIYVNRGCPDGLTVDKFDNLWSANWDGGCITCYDTKGEIKQIIRLKSQRPTSCCFGSDRYSQLFITSAYFGIQNKSLNDGLCTVYVFDSIGIQPNLANI